MDFRFSPDEESFRTEVKDFLALKICRDLEIPPAV